MRGQVSWGQHADPAKPLRPWIPFPANGNGTLVPRFPLGDQADGDQGWVMGSTFERDVQSLPPSATDIHAAHATNWAKLQGLLPGIAPQLEPLFAQALLAPDEIWARVEWMYALQKAVVRRRYIAHFTVEGQEVPALVVFELGSDGWAGITAFQGAAQSADDWRVGVRLFAREQE